MSYLEKDCLAQTSPNQNGFFDTLSDLQNEQHNPDLSLQFDYLQKLTRQRQRIQELSKKYQEKEDQVKKLTKSIDSLERQNQKLREIVPYKNMYEELLRDYNLLNKKNEVLENQVEDLKIELSHVIHQNSQAISKAKGQIKKLQNQKEQKISKLLENLADKESQFGDVIAQYKNRQFEIKNQLQQLKKQIELEKQQYLNSQSKLQRTLDVTINHLKNSQYDNQQLQIHIDECRKSNICLRDQFNKQLQQMEEKQSQLKSQLQKLRHQTNSLKRDCKQRDSTINLLKQNIKKLNDRLISEQKKNDEAEYITKKNSQAFELKMRDLNEMAHSQHYKYEQINYELKQSIEDLINVKNQLILENRKLKQAICRKQMTQRKRKNLINSELKQINKMESAVKRIL